MRPRGSIPLPSAYGRYPRLARETASKAAGRRKSAREFDSLTFRHRGVEQLVARRVHVPEVAGSSPAPATSECVRLGTGEHAARNACCEGAKPTSSATIGDNRIRRLKLSINRVNISGNLTHDPELRATQGGTGILTFGVAVNDRRKNPQTGEWEDYPNFVNCVVFGGRAEPLSKFLSKGSKVAIEGKLRWSQWEKDGQKRSKLEVIVDEVEFMSRSNDGQQQQQQPAQQQQAYNQPAYQQPQYQQPTYTAPQPPSDDLYDESIPF